MPKRIAEAHAAIDQRVAQLRSQHGSNKGGPDGLAARLSEEEQAIADALAGIRILTKEIS